MHLLPAALIAVLLLTNPNRDGYSILVIGMVAAMFWGMRVETR